MSNTTAFRGKIKLEPIRQNMFYQRHANKPNYRNISNLNEIIEEKTNEKSAVQPTTNNRNSYLSTEEKRSMLNNPTFIASKQPLSFSDSAAFCNYNSLDNNMLKMGMDIKTIDPKLKKYGVGENGIYIPTDLVVKKVTNIVNAEKIRIAEEIYNKEVKIKEEETKEKIEVISESGDIRIYTLTIKKEKKISNKIKSLKVSEGVLSPEFNKEILEYNVRIPNEKEKITLEIELEDKEGTYRVINSHYKWNVMKTVIII